MSCCPDNAGASVAPCPTCDGTAGATTDPAPCQCNYNLGPVLTCCCTSDNNPPVGCCIEPTTTTMRLPTTLSVTLSNISQCPCVSGGFDITYDPTNNWWIGSGSLGSCGHSIQLKFGCGSQHADNCFTCGWWATLHYPDACSVDVTCQPPAVDLCGPPLTFRFDWSGPTTCGCSLPPPSSFRTTITL